MAVSIRVLTSVGTATGLSQPRTGAGRALTPVVARGERLADADRRVLGIVTEADLLLKQEHPDPELDVPLAWSRRRRLERTLERGA